MQLSHRTQSQQGFQPRQLHSVEETGVSLQFLNDLALKIIYYASTISGHDIALRMRLPYVGIIDRVLDGLKRDLYVEVRGGSAVSTASYVYNVTTKGNLRAGEL